MHRGWNASKEPKPSRVLGMVTSEWTPERRIARLLEMNMKAVQRELLEAQRAGKVQSRILAGSRDNQIARDWRLA